MTEEIAEIGKYLDVFPKAWARFLRGIKEGEIISPDNEAWLHCYLFSECLSIMREEKFKIPHAIVAENPEIMGKG